MSRVSRAVGRSYNLKGQVITQGLCKERVLLLFLPKSGGVGVGVETKRGGGDSTPSPPIVPTVLGYITVLH